MPNHPERLDAPQQGVGGRLGTPEHSERVDRDSPQSVVASPRRIEKPWGYELIWAQTDEYVGKVVHVRAGEALSLQFHEEKDETLFLLRGQVTLEIGPGVNSLQRVLIEEGEAFRIRPGVLHRVVAETEVEILEASTPEMDDIIRVRDRYGRLAQMLDSAE